MGSTSLLESPPARAGNRSSAVSQARPGVSWPVATVTDRAFLGSLRVGLTTKAYDNYNVDARFDDFSVYAVGDLSAEGRREASRAADGERETLPQASPVDSE